MVGIEFCPGQGLSSKVTKYAHEEGMLLLSCGVFDSVRLIPPLTVSASEIDTGLKILEKVMLKCNEK